MGGRGCGGYDGVARVPQRLVTFLVLSSFSNHRRISLTHTTGGLLVDFGVLKLRPDVLSPEYLPDGSIIPRLPPSHPAVVEWRAMTVIELSVSSPLVLFDMALMVLTFAVHAHAPCSQRSDRKRSQTEVQPRLGTTDARASARERDVERRPRDCAKAASGDGGTAHRHYQRRNCLLVGGDRNDCGEIIGCDERV